MTLRSIPVEPLGQCFLALVNVVLDFSRIGATLLDKVALFHCPPVVLFHPNPGVRVVQVHNAFADWLVFIVKRADNDKQIVGSGVLTGLLSHLISTMFLGCTKSLDAIGVNEYVNLGWTFFC